MATNAFATLAAEKMTIREISQRWSTELEADWRDIELRLLTVSLDGSFDDLPSGYGLLTWDKASCKHWSTTGARVRTQLEKSGHFIECLRQLRNDCVLCLHKDAVLFFANKAGLNPPSWWPHPPKITGKPVITRKVGRPRTKMIRVIREMREFDRSQLANMKLASMPEIFKAHIDTCRRALAEVLPRKNSEE